MDYYLNVPIELRTPREKRFKENEFKNHLRRKYIFKNLVCKIIEDKRLELKKKPEYLLFRFLYLLKLMDSSIEIKEYIDRVIERRRLLDEIRVEERLDFERVSLLSFQGI